MKIQTLLLLFFVSVATDVCRSQPHRQPPIFTRADTLRGLLTPLRTCFDVTYYHLDIKVDPGQKTISGKNTIQFRAVTNFDRLQIDLAQSMEITEITSEGRSLRFKRDETAVYVELGEEISAGSIREIAVAYHGQPQEATRPPWDGGLIWREDEKGNPWVAVTVQGDGAMLWWPNKEHQSDEPDSMLMSITVPDTLMNVSNGRLRRTTPVADGWTRWDWFISYPINNYNVTLNIGKFAHFDDVYVSADGDTLTLDYYVMPHNLDKAREQFKQVHPMMRCMEKLFGKYPFYRDGYKLIESSHNGMEHQSAVAYGNGYRNGYRFQSFAKIGLEFDFIILHESAHEWWGNSVTSKDIADMWIHESFGAYTEALYVECRWGIEAGLDYQFGRRPSILNNRPIIGVYDVNYAGSGDMYSKGAVVLGTLRSVVNNDSLWFAILRGIQKTFAYQTVTAEQIFGYINQRTGQDFTYFFDQYFRRTSVPELQIRLTQLGEQLKVRYRWVAETVNFRMPVKVTTARDKLDFIFPTAEWQELDFGAMHADNVRVAEREFYIDVNLSTNFRFPDVD